MTSATPKVFGDRLQQLAEAPVTHAELAAHLLGIPITEVTAEQRRLIKEWRFLKLYSVASPFTAVQRNSLLDKARASVRPPVEDFNKLEDLDFSTIEVRVLAHMQEMENVEAMRTSGTYTTTGRYPSSPEWQDLPRSWK